MIPLESNLINQCGGVQEKVEFSAKSENLGVLFEILRKQLYSDPVMAVIREYSCNSRDANVMAGKPTEPITVSLPTLLDSFLKIRDYGNGLSDEEVKEIFSSYGASTKRDNQEAIGMLGIGCKSGFAYVDQFIVNSYKNGKLSAWSAFIDPSNRGTMSLMATDDTSEPDGLEVIIPVKTQDISKFISKAFHFFSFWDIKPKLLNLTSEQEATFKAQCEKTSIFSGKNWKALGVGTSYAVMGNIPYPISASVFVGEELNAPLRELLNKGIILNFNIGDLTFSASREELRYEPSTKKKIVDALSAAHKEIVCEVEKSFVNCKTLWDAKILFNEVFGSRGKYYSISSLVNRNIKFNNISVTGAAFQIQHNKKVLDKNDPTGKSYTYAPLLRAVIYRKDTNWGSEAKIRKENCHNIYANSRTLVVVNDKKICNGILNRIVGPIETKICDCVIILNFEDDADKQEWLKLSQFDGPMVALSSLPKEPLSKYYLDTPKPTGFKKKTDVFTLDLSAARIHGRFAKSSAFWKESDLDIKTGDGVYVVIDRFDISVNDTGYGNHHPLDLVEKISALEKYGLKIPTIYAVKTILRSVARDNKKLVLFDTWLEAAIKEKINNGSTINELNEIYQKTRSLLNLGYNYPFIFNNIWGTERECPLQKVVTNINKIYKKTFSPQITDLYNLVKTYTPALFNSIIRTDFPLQKELEGLKDKYPLLFLIIESAAGSTLNKNSILTAAKNYVEMIDKENPVGPTSNPESLVE